MEQVCNHPEDCRWSFSSYFFNHESILVSNTMAVSWLFPEPLPSNTHQLSSPPTGGPASRPLWPLTRPDESKTIFTGQRQEEEAQGLRPHTPSTEATAATRHRVVAGACVRQSDGSSVKRFLRHGPPRIGSRAIFSPQPKLRHVFFK